MTDERTIRAGELWNEGRSVGHVARELKVSTDSPTYLMRPLRECMT